MAFVSPTTPTDPVPTYFPLASGHAAIDDDHRQLDEMVTRFREAVAASNLPRAMHLFDSLLTGMQVHFKREEGLLIAALAPDRYDHMTAHEEVMREMLTIRQDSFRVLRCWPERVVDLLGHLLRRNQMQDRALAASISGGAMLPSLTLSYSQ
jgi:hemerythrin-like metal-binding protein